MIFINDELSACNRFACVQLGFQRTSVCSCGFLHRDQILRVFKPSADMCLSLRNVVVNSWQRCTMSCVKLRTSCPARLKPQGTRADRDSALLSLPRKQWLIFLFCFPRSLCKRSDLEYKMYVCIYLSIYRYTRTEALLFL